MEGEQKIIRPKKTALEHIGIIQDEFQQLGKISVCGTEVLEKITKIEEIKKQIEELKMLFQ